MITFDRSDPVIERANADSWSAVRTFLGGEYRGSYFWGPCGTGKTFAASCLVSEAESYGRSVSMITAPEFVRRMRLFDPGDAFKEWKYSALWILDDIDKGSWKPNDIRSLWEVLDARMDSYFVRTWRDHPTKENTVIFDDVYKPRKTIITGNVDQSELRAYLVRCADGDETLIESIMQRLHPIQVLEFSGKSFR